MPACLHIVGRSWETVLEDLKSNEYYFLITSHVLTCYLKWRTFYGTIMKLLLQYCSTTVLGVIILKIFVNLFVIKSFCSSFQDLISSTVPAKNMNKFENKTQLMLNAPASPIQRQIEIKFTFVRPLFHLAGVASRQTSSAENFKFIFAVESGLQILCSHVLYSILVALSSFFCLWFQSSAAMMFCETHFRHYKIAITILVF